MRLDHQRIMFLAGKAGGRPDAQAPRGFAFLPLDWALEHFHTLVATRPFLASGLNLPPAVSITGPSDGTTQ